MGLKLQNSCNLLNKLVKSSHQRLSIAGRKGTSDSNKLQNSMDRFLERCNRESIKNTMLEHEEIFQKQVHELHRLYHVQKMMMIELRSKEANKMNSAVADYKTDNVTGTKNKYQSSTSTSETTYSSHDVPNAEKTSVAAGQVIQEPSNCLREPLRMSDERCNLDLTLSIGSASDKKRKTDWNRFTNDTIKLLPSNLNRPENGKECTNSTGGFAVERLQRPHWLVQALSLNRT